MGHEEHKIERLLAKFKPFIERAGGIFTSITRKRLLGMEGLSGRNRTKDDFWHDQRENVKMALIDLELFIEAAGDDRIRSVVTEDTLMPVLESLLWDPVVYGADPDLERAKIAELLVKFGFNYLSNMKRNQITLSHRRTIEEAIDLSHFLLDSFRPESDRGRVRGN